MFHAKRAAASVEEVAQVAKHQLRVAAGSLASGVVGS
jgi:hypothetical protein